MEGEFIRFPWEIKVNGGFISIDEYFQPYQENFLMELIEEKSYLHSRIKSNKDRVSLTRQVDSEFLVPDSIREGYGWLNSRNDYTQLSLWDYLAEIKSVLNLYQHSNSEDSVIKNRLSRLAYYEMLSRIKLDIAKVDLSILELVDWHNDDKLEDEIREFYVLVTEYLLQDSTEPIMLAELDRSIDRYTNYNFNPRVNQSIVKIFDWLNTLISEELTDAQKKDINSLVRKELSLLPKKLGQHYDDKRVYIKYLRRMYNIDYDKRNIYELILNNQYFEEKKQDIFNKLIRSTVEYNSMIPDVEDIDYAYRINQLESFFDNTMNYVKEKTEIGKKILSKYNKDNRGCFALMKTSNNIVYFSFSGLLDYEHDTRANNYNQLAALVLNKVLDTSNSVKSRDVRNHNGTFRWAYLNDHTLRYVDQVANGVDTVIYLGAPIELKDELSSATWKSFKKTDRSYGCCERKILSFSKDHTYKDFYIRWAPCKKCCPALIDDAGAITTYAYSYNFDTWLDDGRPTGFKKFGITNQLESIEV